MKRFLYISPYFPPQRRVGALRPLKFVRHLPSFGWSPVVLADLPARAALDWSLFERVPSSTVVSFDYGFRASVRRRQQQARRGDPQLAAKVSRWKSYFNPEWIPLGEHSPGIPWAIFAAKRALARHPCDAIVVNADPYAACCVGWQVGIASGLPVIYDLRDPWAPCELRRPRRPALQRRLVDWLERRCVQDAARVVLNTERAREDYLRHYPDLPEQRFECIRNHSDPELINAGEYPRQDRYTLLVLGSFRRFVEGDVLFQSLAELKRRGFGDQDLCLLTSGSIPPEARALAERWGVGAWLKQHSFIPYQQVGSFMRSADLLVSLSHRTQQRIPAKFYDYVSSPRPVLAITDSLELTGLAQQLKGVHAHGLLDIRGVADTIEREVKLGRLRHVERGQLAFESRLASERLAAILDDVSHTSGRP